MNISGRFTTGTTVEALAGLAGNPELLTSVSTLEDVGTDSAGNVVATFVPVTALGRFVLRTTITTVRRDEHSARLHVLGRHGGYRVTVDLTVNFAPDADSTEVTWDADVAVHGIAASVGQRVAQDVARRVIGDVLAESAGAARQPA